MRMNVESFNLDHRAVNAPYIRVAERKTLHHGDILVKYDLRFTQPNAATMEMAALHSLEHSFAECVRNHSNDVVDFSPMGCQTGFYLILAGEHSVERVFRLIEQTLRDVLELDEVPAANEIQCGFGANHSLDGAKALARDFLAQKNAWAEVLA